MQIATKDTTERTSLYGKAKVRETTPVGPAEFLLSREMTHRINNELRSTIGFFSRVAALSDNCGVKLALERSIEHLYDHAGIYRAVADADGKRPGERDCLSARGLSIDQPRQASQGIELVLVEHPVRLSSMQCWKVGMIVSELITNSCRHAFADGGGSIRIELKSGGLAPSVA